METCRSCYVRVSDLRRTLIWCPGIVFMCIEFIGGLQVAYNWAKIPQIEELSFFCGIPCINTKKGPKNWQAHKVESRAVRRHNTGCLKKRGIWAIMWASIVGPVWVKGYTVGTQKTFPVVPIHTLRSYFTFLCLYSAPYSPYRSYNRSQHQCANQGSITAHTREKSKWPTKKFKAYSSLWWP